MITDLTLLKVFCTRKVYESYIDYVQVELLDLEIRTILLDFKEYFEEFDHAEINLEEFPTWFHHYRHPDLAQSQHQVYKLIFEGLQKANSEIVEKVLIRFQELATSEKIRKYIDEKFNSEALLEIIEEHNKKVNKIEVEDEAVILNSLDTILEATNRAEGLSWRLNCLNNTIGPLSRGMLVIAAAYVDVGKTMFAVSEATYMARQMSTGCVLWLNNEEDDLRVYKKIWKSVLGCSDVDLATYKEKAEETYKERMHGDLNRIKLVDIRKKNIKDIAKLFEIYKPSLCIIDQVDKIENKSFKAFSDHDRLKNIYGEVRSLANEYCPIIAISQADVTTVKYNKDTGDIEYTLYPHHRQLDGSKVGKPGEADAIIMIGRKTGYPNTRGVHVSKNKFGDMIKQEVIFNGEHARYENP